MDRPGCVAADQQIWDELQLARFQVNLQMVSSALVQKINTNTLQAEKENEQYLDQLEENSNSYLGRHIVQADPQVVDLLHSS